MSVEPFFLHRDGGRRFCVFHPASSEKAKGAFVYVHPFAEEMNKSRRMAALQSRALAAAGHAVLQIDLHGCGDSSGGFGDASWAAWIDDVVGACAWIIEKTRAPLWLWGLRAGCLLASEAARQVGAPCNFLFWQPSSTGKAVLQQFLRLKVASEMLSGQSKSATDAMRRNLERGDRVDIAGYVLSPSLASGLAQATLRPPAGVGSSARVEWLELSNRTDASLSPASLRALEAWQDLGYAVRSELVEGPAFWQSAEIEDAPRLIAATLACLSDVAPT